MNFNRRAFLSLTALTFTRKMHARVAAIETISAQPEFYHGWPTVARRANGELLAAYSGGREAHICPFGRVELSRSSDGGTSWSWPEVIFDSPIDDRDAGICVTPAGPILVTTFTSLAYQAVLDAAKNWPGDRLAGSQSTHHGCPAPCPPRHLDATLQRRRDDMVGALPCAAGQSTWSRDAIGRTPAICRQAALGAWDESRRRGVRR